MVDLSLDTPMNEIRRVLPGTTAGRLKDYDEADKVLVMEGEPESYGRVLQEEMRRLSSTKDQRIMVNNEIVVRDSSKRLLSETEEAMAPETGQLTNAAAPDSREPERRRSNQLR